MEHIEKQCRIIKNGNYGISSKPTGRIDGTVAAKHIIEYSENNIKNSSHRYLVVVTHQQVDVKFKADINSKTVKTVKYGSLLTIVGEKDGWGHLKIGGWIPLDQVKRIGE